ncbi:MAG: hypothetical protein NC318_12895 [Blautia sp.]|nr:hypothetical protein [Blautia sp.]
MKVQLLRNGKPICYNLQKWDKTHSPILLITGLSGSGKTTFAQKFAKCHDAICVSFDVLKFYPESPKQSQKLLDIFLEKYPKIKKNISIRWKKTDKAYSNDILFDYYCNLFFDFLIEYSKLNKKKIVLEGIQVFVRLHPAKSVGLPIIIIRNSGMHSFFNKLKRDHLKKELFKIDFRFLSCVIYDIYVYYVRQRKLLNMYIKYLTTLHKLYNIASNIGE